MEMSKINVISFSRKYLERIRILCCDHWWPQSWCQRKRVSYSAPARRKWITGIPQISHSTAFGSIRQCRRSQLVDSLYCIKLIREEIGYIQGKGSFNLAPDHHKWFLQPSPPQPPGLPLPLLNPPATSSPPQPPQLPLLLLFPYISPLSLTKNTKY